MASRRQLRPAVTLVALCTAAMTAAVMVPGAAEATPRPSLAQVQRQVADLDRQAEVAAERVNAAGDAAQAAQARLDAVRAQVAESEQALAAVRVVAGAMAADSYRAGGMSPVLHALMSRDPDQFLDRAASAREITNRQGDIVRQVVTAQRVVSERQAAAAAEAARLADIERQRVADSAEVAKKAAAAEALLDSLQAEERERLAAAEAASVERAVDGVRASRGSSRSGSESVAPSSSASGPGAIAVQVALEQVGDAYVYAANGPSAFDCSGLTTFAWRAAGVSLPRSSTAQYAAGTKVSKSDLRPGDLVYFYSPISHVGIYMGDGMVVHAANPRTGVNVAPMDSMPYVGATRP